MVQNQKQNQDQQKKKPDFEYRCGKIRGTVWSEEKQGDRGTYTSYTVKIEKSYKDGSVWKTTTSFFPDELPRLVLVAQKCFEVVSMHETER